jgi:hypothetical protein
MRDTITTVQAEWSAAGSATFGGGRRRIAQFRHAVADLNECRLRAHPFRHQDIWKQWDVSTLQLEMLATQNFTPAVGLFLFVLIARHR